MSKAKPAAERKAAHSIRTTDSRWAAAKRRADADGTTVSEVMDELLDGYGRGLINLPKITKTYVQTSASPPSASVST
jgi:hypothetical protein